MSQRCYTCGRETPLGETMRHFIGCEVGSATPPPASQSATPVNSRSRARRIAAERGEPWPRFGGPDLALIARMLEDYRSLLVDTTGKYARAAVQRQITALEAADNEAAARVGMVNGAASDELPEPVAFVSPTWHIAWVGNSPLAPIVRSHGVSIGDGLYTADQMRAYGQLCRSNLKQEIEDLQYEIREAQERSE